MQVSETFREDEFRFEVEQRKGWQGLAFCLSLRSDQTTEMTLQDLTKVFLSRFDFFSLRFALSDRVV